MDAPLSQFKLGILEGIESIIMGRPTDWRASGLQVHAPPDEPFWLPPAEVLHDFNEGIGIGFALAHAARRGP